MKNKMHSIIFGFVFSVLFLSSCSFGFEPSWKEKEKAIISLQFSSLDSIARATDGSRAIIQGDGFLYVRTLGGPKGDKGPLYGPYTIKAGSSFETNDIPAGTYSKGIAVLYSAIELGSLEATMKLPDDQFLTAIYEASFTDSLSGVASGVISEPKTIKSGQKNSLSLTLIPIVNSASTVDFGLVKKYTVTPATTGGSVQKFIRLDNVTSGLPAGDTIKDLVCTASGAGTVSLITLYDSAGALMPTTASTTEPGKYTASYTSGATFYLYIECSGGTVDLSFDAIFTSGATSVGNVLVSISGAAAEAGKTVYFQILPTSEIESETSLAAGKFVIASDGSGSGSAMSLTTGLPITLTPGTYFVWAYIDMNANAVSGFDGLDAGEPSFISTGTAVTASQTTIPLARTSFTAYSPYDGYVYYVSNAGGGNGSLPSSPLTFIDAYDAIYNNTENTSGVDGRMNWIVLTEPITTSVAWDKLTDSKDVTITSNGSTPYTLTLGASIYGGAFLEVGDTTLTLMDVTISGDSSLSIYAERGLVEVLAGGEFTMSSGSKLTNNQALDSGGGVYVEGGTFNMSGGEISDCTTDEGGGGGVFVDSSGTFTMSGGEISYCTSALGGGGVYVTSGSFSMSGGMISNCSSLEASSGGGVYIGSGSFSMSGGEISNCTSSYNGGGVYIYSGSMTFGGTAAITGNTATTFGGGLYLGSSLSAFSRDSTTISITGNKILSGSDIGSGVYINDNGTSGSDAYAALNSPAYVHDNFYDTNLDSEGKDVSLMGS